MVVSLITLCRETLKSYASSSVGKVDQALAGCLTLPAKASSGQIPVIAQAIETAAMMLVFWFAMRIVLRRNKSLDQRLDQQ